MAPVSTAARAPTDGIRHRYIEVELLYPVARIGIEVRILRQSRSLSVAGPSKGPNRNR
jgi:hypothetical protein